MRPSVFLDHRDLPAVPDDPAIVQWMVLDVGTGKRKATIRIPIPHEEGTEAQFAWIRRQLPPLITKLKNGERIEPIEIEREDGVSLDVVIEELETALTHDNGISEWRGRWPTD